MSFEIAGFVEGKSRDQKFRQLAKIFNCTIALKTRIIQFNLFLLGMLSRRRLIRGSHYWIHSIFFLLIRVYKCLKLRERPFSSIIFSACLCVCVCLIFDIFKIHSRTESRRNFVLARLVSAACCSLKNFQIFFFFVFWNVWNVKNHFQKYFFLTFCLCTYLVYDIQDNNTIFKCIEDKTFSIFLLSS